MIADLADLTLTEAVAAMQSKAASSVEVLEACLSQLDAFETEVNAVVWIDRDDALEHARAADAATARGESLGVLHGLPLAHKDMYYQAGRRSSCGSAIRRDFVPDITATVIERMSVAGAYAFAGLNMAEFAQNGTGHNAHYGDCRNPWNLAYMTGGSSSGSGAAVAARYTYAALGSDTGGSIRLPAAANGVSGLKPTQTRVSRYGVMPLSFSADNVGPLARTARDCARIMSVIAGHDPRDPTSSTMDVADYEAGLDGDLRGVRVGIPTNFFLDGCDAPVVAAFDEAVKALVARGATVLHVDLPYMDAIQAYVSVISRAEGGAIHAQWMRERPQDFAVHISSRLFASLAVPAVYYVEAQSRRGPVLKAFCADVFTKVDVILSPTIRCCVPTLAATHVDGGLPETVDKAMGISTNTRPFNYLGLPAASIACGFDPDGLPISLQIAGRPFAEATVLKVADAYQQETNWHRQRPTMKKA